MVHILNATGGNSLFGVSYDTIFTTLITISIFILGYLFNRVYEWRKETRHFKEIRELVRSHLQSLVGPIDKQILEYKKFGDHLASHKLEDYAFRESPIQTDFLNSISYLDVYQAFKLGTRTQRTQRIEAFSAVFQVIEFIRRQNVITKDQFSELQRIRAAHVATWNDSNNDMLRFHDRLLGFAGRNGVTPSEDTYLKDLNAIVHNLSQQPNGSDFEVIYKHFVQPILALVKRYSSDPRTDFISPLVLRSSKAYEDLLRLLDIHSNYYLEQSRNLKIRREMILTAVALLQ